MRKMIRENIRNAGIFCLLIALLMTLIALIINISQNLFNILQEFNAFEDKYMISIAFLVFFGVVLAIIDRIVNKD